MAQLQRKGASSERRPVKVAVATGGLVRDPDIGVPNLAAVGTNGGYPFCGAAPRWQSIQLLQPLAMKQARFRFPLGTAGYEAVEVRPVLEGERLVGPFAPFSDVDLLRDAQRIFGLNTQVSYRSIDLRVAKKELPGPQVSCLAIDLGRLGAS